MKKKLFTIAIALCMVFTMIPGGYFRLRQHGQQVLAT